MSYDWEINGRPVQITEQTSIWAGQYFYESKVWVEGMSEDTRLVTGIADLHDNESQSYRIKNTNILYSYGQQSENKDLLGMAVLMPSDRFAFTASAPKNNSDIVNSWLIVQRIPRGVVSININSYQFFFCNNPAKCSV